MNLDAFTRDQIDELQHFFDHLTTYSLEEEAVDDVWDDGCCEVTYYTKEIKTHVDPTQARGEYVELYDLYDLLLDLRLNLASNERDWT